MAGLANELQWATGSRRSVTEAAAERLCKRTQKTLELEDVHRAQLGKLKAQRQGWGVMPELMRHTFVEPRRGLRWFTADFLSWLSGPDVWRSYAPCCTTTIRVTVHAWSRCRVGCSAWGKPPGPAVDAAEGPPTEEEAAATWCRQCERHGVPRSGPQTDMRQRRPAGQAAQWKRKCGI